TSPLSASISSKRSGILGYIESRLLGMGAVGEGWEHRIVRETRCEIHHKETVGEQRTSTALAAGVSGAPQV
ncbi:MAG: hypothetical protein KAX66_10720, partial [Propionivibrio sp.]|nr:hypothetical protein [Propionivibrio sp.]